MAAQVSFMDAVMSAIVKGNLPLLKGNTYYYIPIYSLHPSLFSSTVLVI
jgi:hypothetical protein